MRKRPATTAAASTSSSPSSLINNVDLLEGRGYLPKQEQGGYDIFNNYKRPRLIAVRKKKKTNNNKKKTPRYYATPLRKK
jgi:hypothetical protein